jgi:NAD(P)-dependent dehydrogenase (short-subunit alcohol dehydrogenase family)
LNKCVIVAGSSGLIGKQLTLTLLREENLFVLGIDLIDSGISQTNFQQFIGDVLDLSFLKSVSDWICERDLELVGIVSAFSVAEYNNEELEMSMSLLNEIPELPWRTAHLLASWASYPHEYNLRAFEVNCLGVDNVVRSQLKNLLKSSGASIVHVASQYGLVVPRQQIFDNPIKFSYKPPAYSLSKASLLMLTKYQASMFSGTKVRVNSISPGGIENKHSDEFIKKYSRHTWTNRMMKIEEVLGPIRFLLSDSSSYMNGANLVIDGGWTNT